MIPKFAPQPSLEHRRTSASGHWTGAVAAFVNLDLVVRQRRIRIFIVGRDVNAGLIFQS